MLESIERQVEAEKRAGASAATGPVTLKTYGEKWLAGRPAQGIATAIDDATRMRLHVLPVLGAVPLSELRPRHIRDLVHDLRAKKSKRDTPLAPRTIRVYATLHRMLADAVVDELLEANSMCAKARQSARPNRQRPCVADDGDLRPRGGRAAHLRRAGFPSTGASCTRCCSSAA